MDEFSENPKSFISQCVKKYVNEVVDIILPHGGFINPEHFKVYKNINVGYLCYNSGNYNPCINEHPMLLNEVKEQIKGYIAPRIDGCFNDYKKEIEKRAGNVVYKDMNL